MFSPSACRSIVVGFSIALLSSCSPTPTGPPAGKVLFEKIINSYGDNSPEVSWASIDEKDNASFTMKDVTIKYPNSETNITIGTLNVEELREPKEGHVTYSAISFSEIAVAGDKKFTSKVENIETSNGALPYAIWSDGLTEEEKKERIKFESFSVSKASGERPKNGDTFSMDALNLKAADIPLSMDLRYDPEAEITTTEAPLKLALVSLSNLKGTAQSASWSLAGISLNDLVVPTHNDGGFSQWLETYSKFSFKDFLLSFDGTEIMSLSGITGELEKPDASGDVWAKTSMDDLVINLSAIPAPQAQLIISQFGYDKIEANMTGRGSVNPTTGETKVDDLELALTNMFDLKMAYSLGGYTDEFARKMAQAQEKVAAGASAATVYANMMGAFSDVKLNSLNLELTDRSLVGRALDFQAKQMGTTGDQLAVGAPVMMGLAMAGLGMPQFTEMVTKAVGTFLKDKGTLSVSANPEKALPLLNLFLAAQTSPKKVPELLNLKVSAQ